MTQAQTQLGWVEGERRDAHLVFRGIPFAKPPTGKLRFHAPEPAEPWTGVRSARAFGPSSLQAASRMASPGAHATYSEDCLYLNVWTTAKVTPDGKKLDAEKRDPVRAFAHLNPADHPALYELEIQYKEYQRNQYRQNAGH